MIELFKELIATSRERLKNPFVGAFVMAWIAVNWKPISIMLFSTQSVEDKIILISSKHEFINNSLLIPIGIALVYVAVLPYLMVMVDVFVKFSVRMRMAMKIEVDRANIIGKQVLVEEEIKLEDLKARNMDKTELNNKIESLETVLNKQSEIINGHVTSLSEKETVIKGLEKFKNDSFEVKYKVFQNSSIYEFLNDIALAIAVKGDFPEGVTDDIKKQAIKQGLVVNDNGNPFKYSLSDLGSRFYARMKIDENNK